MVNKFHKACKEGKIDLVKKFIKYKCFLNKKIHALILASEYGNLEIVKILVENGADPTVEDNLAILAASRYGHLEIVRFLVSVGADPSAQENKPIIWATWNGNLEIVKYLFSIGVRLNNILSYAVKGGHIDTVKYLISQGVQDCPITSALEYAVYYDNLEMTKYLFTTGMYSIPLLDYLQIILVNNARNISMDKFLVSIGVDWKKFPQRIKKILKARQIEIVYVRNKLRFFSKTLIPVYFAPSYTGGKIAKKELRTFVTRLL